ncbi:MAG: lysylphosphatidylglycerol synthase transmembrane domain-containing protein [Candidatus Lernaella stagnicola]|nr:lysylphosphatidylglycerol synthase transmembrane domain-containing protein [Candidatus Lernaella stagnicola]
MADVKTTPWHRDPKTWIGLLVLAIVVFAGFCVAGPDRIWQWLLAYKYWLLFLILVELAMAGLARSRDPKVYVGLAISVLFIWLAFRDLDPRLMGRSILEANPWLLLFVSAQVLFMLFVRGHRWTLFLKPVKPGISWIKLGWSTCVGFAVNNMLPARLGEVARSISASRKTGLPFTTVFGSVVVERLYDTLSVLVLFVLSLFVFDFAEPMQRLTAAVYQEFGYEITQRSIAINFGALVALILAAIITLKWKTEWSLRVARIFLRPLPVRWRDKIIDAMRTFIGGLTQTTNPWEIAWILFLSAGLWVISWFSVMVGLWACGIDVGGTEAVLVIMAMVIAVSIPASPGYVGPYHFLTAKAITMVANVPWEQAFAAATAIHLANYIPQTLSGLYALSREGISLKQITDEASHTPDRDPATS